MQLLDMIQLKKPPFLFNLVMMGIGIGAFLTGVKFVPSVDNNIGPFELSAGLLFLLAFIYYFKNRIKIQFHPVVKLLYLILVVAVLSLPNLSDRIDWGLIQLLLLAYTFVLVLVMHNLLTYFPSLIKTLLRFVVVGAAIAGIWILYEGITTDNRVPTGGPFRNRSHIGIYMATAFWLKLLYCFWPNVSKVERAGVLLVLAMTLYGVAISGRRSVYLSLFIGLGMLALSFIVIRGTDRFKTALLVLAAAVGLVSLSIFGSQYIPQLDFFQERVGEIDDRLELAAGTAEEIEDSENFIVLQRQGMFEALGDHPLIGIGWGGFFDSEYSPTGHEMHSTPQRFLVELGIIGFSLYLIYNAYLLIGSARIFFRVRNSNYQLPALVFMIAIWSLSISWAYNRSVTERTYWLLIILFISFESLVYMEFASRQKSAAKKNPRPAGYYPESSRRSAPPVMPLSRK